MNTLIIKNDGLHFPEDIDFRNSPSLGLRLICAMVRELGGEINLDRSQGTEFTIKFPRKKK